jgi:hypothetical protein
MDNADTKSDSVKEIVLKDITILQSTLKNDYYKKGLEKELETSWTVEKFTPAFDQTLEKFLSEYKKFYQDAYNRAVAAREATFAALENQRETVYNVNEYKDRYYNESLADLVKNATEKNRIIEFEGELIPQINPIFFDPDTDSPMDYRAHFFAPQKNFFGQLVSTFTFNTLVIWLMTVLLYLTLYFELLRKLIHAFEKVPGKMNLPKVGLSKKK